MANSVLCTKYGNWVHGRCANINRVTTRWATCFFCPRYRGIMGKEMVDSLEKFNEKVNLMRQ